MWSFVLIQHHYVSYFGNGAFQMILSCTNIEKRRLFTSIIETKQKHGRNCFNVSIHFKRTYYKVTISPTKKKTWTYLRVSSAGGVYEHFEDYIQNTTSYLSNVRL